MRARATSLGVSLTDEDDGCNKRGINADAHADPDGGEDGADDHKPDVQAVSHADTRNLISWRVPNEVAIPKPEVETRHTEYSTRARHAGVRDPDHVPDISTKETSRMNTGVGQTDPQPTFQNKLWRYLFSNVNRAVDELYYLCEDEANVERASQAAKLLGQCKTDFEKLAQRIGLQARYEAERSHGVEWEVRKTTIGQSPKIVEGFMNDCAEATSDARVNSIGRGRPPLFSREVRPGRLVLKREHMYEDNQTKNNIDSGEILDGTLNALPLMAVSPRSNSSLKTEDHTEDGTVSFDRTDADLQTVTLISDISADMEDDEDVHTHVLAEEAEVIWRQAEEYVEAQAQAEEAAWRRIELMEHKDLVHDASLSWNADLLLSGAIQHIDMDPNEPSDALVADHLRSIKMVLKGSNIQQIAGGTKPSPPSSNSSLPSPTSPRSTLTSSYSRSLHDKFMSPDRRRLSPSSARKRHFERLQAAEVNRSKLEEERVEKARRSSSRVRKAGVEKASKLAKAEQTINSRLVSAGKRHNEHIRAVRGKAGNENVKVNEVLFINTLNAEAVRINLQQRLADVEARIEAGRIRRQQRLVCISAAQRRRHVKKVQQMSERQLEWEQQNMERWEILQARIESVQARREQRVQELQRRRELTMLLREQARDRREALQQDTLSKAQEREHKRARATARRLGKTPTSLSVTESPVDTHACSNDTMCTPQTPSSQPVQEMEKKIGPRGRLGTSPPPSPNSYFGTDAADGFDDVVRDFLRPGLWQLVLCCNVQGHHAVRSEKQSEGVSDATDDVELLQKYIQDNKKSEELTLPTYLKLCMDECIAVLNKKGARNSRSDFLAACTNSQQKHTEAETPTMLSNSVPATCQKLVIRVRELMMLVRELPVPDTATRSHQAPLLDGTCNKNRTSSCTTDFHDTVVDEAEASLINDTAKKLKKRKKSKKRRSIAEPDRMETFESGTDLMKRTAPVLKALFQLLCVLDARSPVHGLWLLKSEGLLAMCMCLSPWRLLPHLLQHPIGGEVIKTLQLLLQLVPVRDYITHLAEAVNIADACVCGCLMAAKWCDHKTKSIACARICQTQTFKDRRYVHSLKPTKDPGPACASGSSKTAEEPEYIAAAQVEALSPLFVALSLLVRHEIPMSSTRTTHAAFLWYVFAGGCLRGLMKVLQQTHSAVQVVFATPELYTILSRSFALLEAITSLLAMHAHPQEDALVDHVWQLKGRLCNYPRVKEMVGVLRDMHFATEIISCLGCLCMYEHPLRHDDGPRIQHMAVGIASVALKLLNNLAVVDLRIVQDLGSDDVNLTFYHTADCLLTTLISTTHSAPHSPTQSEADECIRQLIVYLGFFSLCHASNQARLSCGRPPTVLLRLCSLPMKFFTSESHRLILLPTLLSMAYNNEANTRIIHTELAPKLLVSFLERHIKTSNVPNAQTQGLSLRFPTELWGPALAFFTAANANSTTTFTTTNSSGANGRNEAEDGACPEPEPAPVVQGVEPLLGSLR